MNEKAQPMRSDKLRFSRRVRFAAAVLAAQLLLIATGCGLVHSHGTNYKAW